ncbi:ATP-binding protein [Hymenobacter terrenus]|uniref:ATP-binding protein n=1 Tax=Hymenobacter terrenus TaxID=1629124 RepID=UPI000619AFEC|nr:ATP-binding protein [Hymenobacter terrenus]
MSQTLFIRQISRFDTEGNEETLEFEEGVNIIVGPTNSGKTVWMAMIDYVLGDDSTADKAFFGKQDAHGINLSKIYSEIRAIIEIGDTEYVLERRWKEQGVSSKTLVDGKPMDTKEFSQFVLEKLKIPISRFVQGNPYSENSILDISFRMMLRHIYRQERFWGDLADRQFPLEQYAVLTKFLGLADKIFAIDNEKLLEKKRELFKLEIEKEQYETTLDKIVRGFNYDGGENLVYATTNLTKDKIKALQSRSEALLQQRNDIISGAAAGVLQSENDDISQYQEVKLSQARAVTFTELDKLQLDREQHTQRIRKYESILASSSAELERLIRVQTTGGLFADLKVTHCPACDQPVHDTYEHPDDCFLCHQHLPVEPLTKENDRLNFEINQVQTEQKELVEILAKMQKGKLELDVKFYSLSNELGRIDRDLAPIRQKLAGLVDARLSVIDQERGRLLEQIENYRRIEKSLETKAELTARITMLQNQVGDLEKDVARVGSPNFEKASDDLVEGMMDYINAIVKDRPARWNHQGRINLLINEKGFEFYIGPTKWSSPGGTTKLYFLFAYHYGLLNLTGKNGYHYPGLLIMDFQAGLTDGELLKRTENYIVQPFIDLCGASPIRLQVIIAGQSFEDLKDCNFIRLEEY